MHLTVVNGLAPLTCADCPEKTSVKLSDPPNQATPLSSVLCGILYLHLGHFSHDFAFVYASLFSLKLSPLRLRVCVSGLPSTVPHTE